MIGRFLLGLSVAVDVFTLVCISVERYIAICRPLLILQLQSLRFGKSVQRIDSLLHLVCRSSHGSSESVDVHSLFVTHHRAIQMRKSSSQVLR